MLLSRLKLGVAGLVAIGGLAWVSGTSRGQGERPAAAAPAPKSAPQADPAPESLPRQLLGTIARVRFKRNGANSYLGAASGTVISSHRGDAVVLTCAHVFKEILPAEQFDGYIVVDFPESNDERPVLSDPPPTYEARLIDCDLAREVALLRFHAGRVLAVSPIVPRGWKPAAGVRMVTAGCDRGGAATLWSTAVLRPGNKGPSPAGLDPLAARPEPIECLRAPEQGRSGGGLFTADGQLAGVCNDSDPAGDIGRYAPPEAIYAILARNGLVHALSGSTTDAVDNGRAPRLFVDKFHRLLDDAREAYSRDDLKAYKSAIAEVGSRLDLRISEKRAELKKLEADRAELHGTPVEILTRVFGSARRDADPRVSPTERGATPARRPGRDPRASPATSDSLQQAARIQELETKLDRVLNDLERLKASQRP